VAGSDSSSALNGGRTWWAHFVFTHMNIELTILYKKIEEVPDAGASVSIVKPSQL
jgi:hypothetical protein